jgi:type IV pilus assembly protein PilC
MSSTTFAYRARDSKGQPVSGAIEARSQTEALRLLEREGKAVTDIKAGVKPSEPSAAAAAPPASPIAEKPRGRTSNVGGVKREEVISFASQLAVMLETGVPLAEALDAFNESTKAGPLRRVVGVVADRIHGGVSFSAAIREYPRVFPSLMVTLLEASEASGKMSMMLGRIAEYLGKERRTARQIKGALTYPGVMVTLAVTVTVFLVTWVLPRFARIYESREAALPALTKFVLGVSNFMIERWYVVAASAAAVIGAYILTRITKRGRRAMDWCKLRFPVLGAMFSRYYLTRATRTLGTLLSSGVPLLDAVRIVRGVTANDYWMDLWNNIESSMTVGGTFSDSIRSSWLVPAPVAQMIAAGEKSGRLPDVLDRVATASEADLDEAIKSATQLIEPAMIVFMGTTIGGIAIALLLPIFNVANVMTK